jgi:putative nucleotidyltransferase with HDIG domain
MSLEYVKPGMQLARTIYDINGRIILSAGIVLSEKHLLTLNNWDIRSVYVDNPVISLPPIDEVVEEATRLKAAQTVKGIFEKSQKLGSYRLSAEQNAIVKNIILQVLAKRLSIIHLAQIQRHHNNLFAHSINVSILATLTAVIFGINNSQDLYAISTGALLNDIGKMVIPPYILEKTSALTPDEKGIYESHTVLGFDMLRRTNELPLLACHMALQHHERMDGQGYPRKISSTDIALWARIVSIADQYDNLLVDSAGCKAVPPHQAYEMIVAGVNTAFDPVVAQAFLSCIALYPTGTMVKLTSGHIAIVASVTAKIQHRPVLKIISDEHGLLLPDPYILDLTEQANLTIFIEEVLGDSSASDFLLKNKE